MPRQRIQWYITVPSAEYKVQYKQNPTGRNGVTLYNR